MTEFLPEAYFTGVYRYRNWSVLAVSMVLGLFSIFFGAMLARQAAQGKLSAGGTAVGLVFMGLPLTGLVFLLQKYVRRVEIHVRIDHDGIACGKYKYPWEEIGMVSGRSVNWPTGIQLIFQKRGRFAMDRHLFVTPPVTLEQYNVLLAELAEKVLPHHPHLVIG